MQRNAVEGNEEIAEISDTLWAYVPCHSDSSRKSETSSSILTLFSSFCCCFTNKDNSHSRTDLPIYFTIGDDPPVTLSKALLCLDNPQITSDLVSYPISEEHILAKHRSQNVLQQPQVIRSTQMLFMGFDITFLQEVDINQRLSLDGPKSTISNSSESELEIVHRTFV